MIEDMLTEELIDELQSRGYDIVDTDIVDTDINHLIESIHQNRRLGKDYQPLLDKLIYSVIGKIA